MPFQVSCPECGYQFRVPDSVAGQRGKCPQCKAVFRAEKPETDSRTAAGPSKPAAADENGASESEAAAAQPAAPTGKVKSLVVPKPRAIAAAKLAATPPPAPPAARAGEKPPPKKLKTAQPLAAAGAEGEVAEFTEAAPPLPAVKAPAAPVFSVAAESGSRSPGGLYASRRKKSQVPALAIVAVLGLIIVAATGVAVFFGMMEPEQVAALFGARQPAAPGDGQAGGRISHDPASSAASGAADPSGGGRPAAATNVPLPGWESVRPRVVALSLQNSADKTRTATGAVVDPRGWIATTVSAIAQAEAGLVTMDDGQKFDIAGTVGRAPRRGLVLLKLSDPPREMPVMQLRAEGELHKDDFVFIATPVGTQSARVLRHVKAEEVPPSLRAQLPDGVRQNPNLTFIEHDAKVIPDADGSPLLDIDGKLVGVNVYAGPQARRGYALPAAVLDAFLAERQRQPESILPLRSGDVAVRPLPPEHEPPDREPPDRPPMPDPPMGDVLAEFERIQASIAEFNYHPANKAQYLTLQQFVTFVTGLQAALDENPDADPELRERIQAALNAATSKLANVLTASWPTPAQMAAANKLGLETIQSDAALAPAVFLYCKCIMRPEDFGDRSINDSPAFAFEVVGTEEVIAMPVARHGAEIEKESVWLVLGHRHKEKISVPLPVRPREAPIVTAKFIVGK